MASVVMNMARLARAGIVLARHGVDFVPRGMKVPFVLHLARIVTFPIWLLTLPFRHDRNQQTRVAGALSQLGPSYIKLGQFLATRGDLIDAELATDLATLQDRLPPFAMAAAEATVEDAFGKPADQLYENFGPPVAAASIAQVHKASTQQSGQTRDVAVKVLRPNIERRFRRDLDSFYFAARQLERFHEPARRLRPVAALDTLAHSITIEMDLRMEAAAISEMADNSADDEGFRVPTVDWQRTAKRVLTLEWIDGIPIGDHAALRAAGHDLQALGLTILHTFLRHAMRDGFFHADMHQGNLFVDADGTIVAVDFGIMGRLSIKERRFLAEILYGIITRDYMLASRAHFAAGYVPTHHSEEVFAQALRAIGEPIQGRTAEEISMADLLGQLFAYTEVFDMQTRPELLLLQKTMVVVEGVARALDPALNLWVAAEPIAREWLEANLGAAGRLRDAGEGAQNVGRFMGGVPALLAQAERTAQSFADMVGSGLRLDDHTIQRLAEENAQQSRWTRRALWTGAIALVVMVFFLVF